MREKNKVVEVNGRNFKINRFSPQTGSWIANLLVTVMVKFQQNNTSSKEPESIPETDATPEQKANNLVTLLWMMAAGDLPETTYKRIQQLSLLACENIHRDDAPGSALITESGKWIAAELEDDGPTVSKLVSEALQFNISPFFVESASNAAQQK